MIHEISFADRQDPAGLDAITMIKMYHKMTTLQNSFRTSKLVDPFIITQSGQRTKTHDNQSAMMGKKSSLFLFVLILNMRSTLLNTGKLGSRDRCIHFR